MLSPDFGLMQDVATGNFTGYASSRNALPEMILMVEIDYDLGSTTLNFLVDEISLKTFLEHPGKFQFTFWKGTSIEITRQELSYHVIKDNVQISQMKNILHLTKFENSTNLIQ